MTNAYLMSVEMIFSSYTSFQDYKTKKIKKRK